MDPLFLSRLQFGDTAAFHILWPLMSIGLASFMFIMESLWLYTKEERYYRQVRFWMKIFILTFAIGVSSGFPLSFQFGTNWAEFSKAAGSFFGNILGFETTVAFTLETASLGIMVFGWHKVPRLVHWFANLGVLVGASLSGFWIMVANSWMQVPQGVIYEGGKFVVVDYMQAIFNPEVFTSFSHMWLACIVSTMFLIGGISAYALLRARHDGLKRQFFADALRYVIIAALITSSLQVFFGDRSGTTIAEHQPAKVAAIELHWDTNLPGEGAAWHVLAWPNGEGTGNAWTLSIPNALSLILTHSPTGQVQGLNDFPADERPTVAQSVIIFYCFRIMIAIGFFLVFLTALSVWYWRKHELDGVKLSHHRAFLWLWVAAIPMGFIATECGWMVREIGRQPWVVYHQMRTADALSSNLESSVIGFTIIGITSIYLVLTVLFVYFTRRIIHEGPDLSSRVPHSF